MPILGRDYHDGAEKRLFQVQKVIEREFPGLWNATETCLSVTAQLKIADVANCLLLIFVGAPSSRKTTMLSWFDGLDITYRSDGFSPASFVSHFAGASKKRLAEIDLLPRVKNKILLTPELLTTFNAPFETLNHNMGILTRVLDGQGYTSDSGVHGQRGYKGFEGDYVFHWLGGIAYVPSRIWGLLGNMGSRVYFYLFPKEKEKTPEELAKELSEDFPAKSKACRNAIHSFVKDLWEKYPTKVKWRKDKDSPDALANISRHAQLLSKLRGNIEYQRINESSEESETYTQPIIEEPHRANQVLYNLARGHALLHGRKYITKDDLPIIRKVALNSARTDRIKLFDILLDNKGLASSKTLAECLDCSRTMALRTMKSLRILGIIDIIKADSGAKGGRPMLVAKLKPEYQWVLSDAVRRSMER